MQELQVTRFAALFRGRTDAWGEVKGRSVQELVTLDHYRRHLAGEVSVGIYMLLDDGTCHFCAADLDKPDLELAKRVRTALLGAGVRGYIALSKSGNYHIYIFFARPVRARDARALLYSTLAKAGLWSSDPDEGRMLLENIGLKHEVEVFPKQIKLEPPLRLGNYINLPYFGKERAVVTMDGRPVPLELFLERAEQNTQEQVDAALETLGRPEEAEPQPEAAKTATEAEKPSGLLCFGKMMAGRWREGDGRDVMAFRLAAHMRRQGTPAEATMAALTTWDRQNIEPLGAKGLRAKVEQAYKVDAKGKPLYSLGCLDAIIRKFCDRRRPVYKSRRGEVDIGEGELQITKLVKRGSQPPTYLATIGEQELELSLDDLLNITQFRKRVAAKLNTVPYIKVTQVKWLEMINEMLQNVTLEPVERDASERTELLDRVLDWLGSSPKAESPEDVRAGKPVERESCYYFRARDIISHLRSEHRMRIKPPELWAAIRSVGGDRTRISVGDTVFRVWALRSDQVEPEEEV